MAFEESDTTEMHVVLVGKTATGKSSLGNSLLGKDAFAVGTPMKSCTMRCDRKTGSIDRQNLEIMDTPGLCNPTRSLQDFVRVFKEAEEFMRERPTVILLTLRCDRRFTEEEYEAFQHLKELFGDDVCKRVVVVFNGLDNMGKNLDEQRKALRRDLENRPPRLRSLLEEVDNRYIGFSNKAPPKEKDLLKQALINKIQELLIKLQQKQDCKPHHDWTSKEPRQKKKVSLPPLRNTSVNKPGILPVCP